MHEMPARGIAMGDPAWKHHRRPHSAGGITVERFSSLRLLDSRPPSKVGSVGGGEALSPELDFTDKLKALRELIASTKTRCHAREESSEKNSGGRIMARRQHSFCEAKEVGGQIQFSAKSRKKQEFMERLRRAWVRRDQEIMASESMFGGIDADILDVGGELYPEGVEELELLLSSHGQKYASRRPHSAAESYSHLLSRDLKQMSLARERAWAAVDLGPESSPKRVTFRRSHSSVDYPHEVPERDWSSPARKLNTDKNRMDAVRSLPGYSAHELPHDVPGLLLTSDVKAWELMKEKASVYKQYSPKESPSPPEHDCPSSTASTSRPIQTNVQLSANPQAKLDSPRDRVRPDSADHVRSSSEKTISAVPYGNTTEDVRHEHWTRLLSQKRDKSDSRSVPSSPATVQSGVSVESAQHSSTHVLLLQEAVRQLQQENRNLKASRKWHTDGDGAEDDASEQDGEEALQDSEVAQILQHPRTKKKIIIKRGSVKVVRETGSAESQQTSHQKASLRDKIADSKSPVHKSKLFLQLHSSSADDDDGLVVEIAKDDHILTLDKLKTLLRGRRAESRPSSQTSTVSVSSPAPLKAVHHNKHHHQGQHNKHHHQAQNGSEDLEIQSAGKAQAGEPNTSKPVQRKIIRRPPTAPQVAKDRKKSLASQQRFVKRGQSVEVPIAAASEEWVNEGRELGKEMGAGAGQRPSSAPHLSCRVMCSSLSTSTKSLGSVSKTRQGSLTGSKASLSSADEKRHERREWSQSSTDVTKRDSDVGSAQCLRSNVQRLHQEVSLRVSQEAYIVQGLMNHADGLDSHFGHQAKVQEPGQIRRRLSFDEDVLLAQKSCKARSQSCVPFGKRLGAGMVDTGSVLGISSLDAVQGSGLILKEKVSAARKAGSEYKTEQAASTTDEESSFLAHVEHMSTSTPRRVEMRQRIAASSLSSAIGGRNVSSIMVPEKETASNLRVKRPASVGAIPFPSSSHRTFSGSDAADVIVSHLSNASMVHLLQRLYTADDATRQAIILKAQYFKQWQSTAHSMKHQRQLYTESLKRAHKFLVSRLQRRCFSHWRVAAEDRRKRHLAEDIQRRHMLRKGLQGFHWAILRSKHQIRTLQVKVHAIVTRTAFAKWQVQFESRREERLQTTFRRWREYAYEEKIVREKQRDQNEKLVYITMLLWREAYDRRVKENIADKYLRRTSLRQCWREWRHFTHEAKVKASRHSLALDLRKRNQQRLTMHVWSVALLQSQKASRHFRKRRLQGIIQAWRQGAEISRVERQRDMAVSLEHWRHATTRHTFLTWYHHLHLCRAVSMADRTLSRKTFEFWRQAWQCNMQRRHQVEALITRSRLRKTLMTWRRHTVDRRRKQRQAVFLLETCLMRVTISTWNRYTAFRAGFRASLQQHVRVIERAVLLRCFHLWRTGLHVRLDERRRQELWSLACVRKMTAHWRFKCHIHRLHVTLQETEPVRDLALLRRIFCQWQAAKRGVEGEKAEAVACGHILQRCALQRRFQQWRLAAHRTLTIRPLVIRKQRQLVTWCFDAWHQLVQSRLERCKRQKQFQRSQLSCAFTRWRRQYHCQQVSGLAHQSFLRCLALCLLHQWRDILQRKHRARHCHAATLLQRSFRLWKDRTLRHLTVKAQRQAQQELSHTLKQQCLGQWWRGVQAQIAADTDSVARLQQRQHHNHIHASFLAWRRSLHAHIISRAYQRTTTLRLLRSVLLEWQEATSQALHSAVQHFAQQLGLTLPQGEEEGGGGEHLVHSLEFKDLLQFGDSDHCVSPCSSSTASLKRLFASDQSTTSEHMYDNDLDLDRVSLLTLGLQETVEERRQKNQRLQGLSVIFITRLCHWPVSVAFSQWQDYTLRQRHLRQLAQEVEEKHRALAVSLAFQRWTVHLTNSQKATSLRNWKLQHGTLTGLLEYSRHRKVKAMLSERARGHLVKNVLGRIFPWWLDKAQEQRHQRTVLHLWTTATPEEAQLLPLEGSLSRQIRHRSMRTCLHAWRVRFLFLVGLKRVYHAQLLGRVLCTWQDWASLRQHQRRKGENLLQARCKTLAFRTWCERLHQKRETERRYQSALDAYLRLVFRCWRDWATVSRQHGQSRAVVESRVNQVCVHTHFQTWHCLTLHALTLRTAHHTHLTRRVLLGWRQATQEGKQLRHTILSFQARSLTSLVGQLFAVWRQCYHHQLQQHRQREERAQHSALHCARHWRHLAQNTRGRKLVVVFRYNRLCRMFHQWQASLSRVEELKERQGVLAAERNAAVMRWALREWRQRLQSAMLLRTFMHRLVATLLQAWMTFAKGCKERRIRGLALQHALQERNLRVYFLYWRQMALRVRSLHNNVEVRLQLRVLQAWHYVTRRWCSQRRLGEKFVRVQQERHLASAFYTLRTRFDYCQGLRDMAHNMCARRDRCLAVIAMTRWKDALDRAVADQFHQRLVCVRTIRKWLKFVMRVKAERQHEEQQTCRALTHHNNTLCRNVLEALRSEVKVKRQLQQRQQRMAIKFASNWKHIANLSATTAVVAEERLYGRYWRCWRLAYVRCQAANRDAALHRRQLLSQVFTSWHSLCPSRLCISSQDLSTNRRTARIMSNESGRDSPTIPRSFLPVPISSSRRSAYDS